MSNNKLLNDETLHKRNERLIIITSHLLKATDANDNIMKLRKLSPLIIGDKRKHCLIRMHYETIEESLKWLVDETTTFLNEEFNNATP